MNKIILFFLFSTSLSAQIKGVVKDSITKEPIPYVSIWVENKDIGTTTDEKGYFLLQLEDKNYDPDKMILYIDTIDKQINKEIVNEVKKKIQNEFYAKISIVIEELDESLFWLEYSVDAKFYEDQKVRSLINEGYEILKILAKARKTVSVNSK